MKELLSIRTIFLLLFILLSIYFLLIKSELYESKTALIVRDLGSVSPAGGIELSFLGMGSNSQLQDSKVVEEYILSLDVFLLLDKKFELTKHFKSESLDFLERLASGATIEEVLEFYRTRVVTNYDDISGILHISYSHTDSKIAQNVLEYMIEKVEDELNDFNRRKALKQLKFIESEHKKNKDRADATSAKLEEYQNTHLFLDPNSDALNSSGIISTLEATLTHKRIELSTLKSYMNDDNYEVQTLKNEIKGIEKFISKKKSGLSGTSESRLNKVLFEYEKLKMQLEFDNEVYKNALIQLETTKLDVLKEAKTLSIVSKPNLPDGYTYPNKPKVFITLVIVMLLMYGIFSMLSAIIKDHKE